MMTALRHVIGRTIAERFPLWLAILVGFVAVYQLLLLAALVVRFENIPNYVTAYNYPANVYEILVSTPALSDAWDIIAEEWLLEIGYMNYDYGNGISEWSLTLWPTKLVQLTVVGALLATCIILLLPGRSGACPAVGDRRALFGAGGGAALVGMSSATLSWVVCCATPTWVVSLAMLGMSASLALWLEPLGDFITISGFFLLIGCVIYLAHRRRSAEASPGDGRTIRARPAVSVGSA